MENLNELNQLVKELELAEKNAIYIQQNINFKKVREYFNQLITQ